MTDGTRTVTTRSNRGQWENHVDERPELSQSYSSREEATDAGAVLAAELGYEHRVVDAPPTGVITDEEDESGDAPDPVTTDERGIPLDNPSG